MKQVTINGIEKTIDDTATLQTLIEQLQVGEKVMALAVNMEVVKKEDWNTYIPKEGDTIEMLNFVGGG